MRVNAVVRMNPCWKRAALAAAMILLLLLGPAPARATTGNEGVTAGGLGATSIEASSLISFLRFLTGYFLPVTTGEQHQPATIIIDTTRCRLLLFFGTRLYHSYPVAVGKPETPTPVGNWRIKRKAMNWGTGFGTRWLGLDVPWGIYGIHGTNKPYTIGGYESAGCIRMFNEDVEALYPLVQPGTPVIVVGSILRGPRVLREGDCGSDVMEVQRLLQRHGYYSGRVDGNFGWEMRKAVVRFRQTHRLPPDDCVDDPVYRLLGL